MQRYRQSSHYAPSSGILVKLQPVYLVTSEPSIMPTRRAFLLTSGTLLAGFGLGGACGYAAGSRASTTDAEQTVESTGDADLDELRRLAATAPIEELMAKSLLFLGLLGRTYRNDTILWNGAERIGIQLLKDAQTSDRRLLAQWLIQVTEKGDPDLSSSVRKLMPELLRVRRGLR